MVKRTREVSAHNNLLGQQLEASQAAAEELTIQLSTCRQALDSQKRKTDAKVEFLERQLTDQSVDNAAATSMRHRRQTLGCVHRIATFGYRGTLSTFPRELTTRPRCAARLDPPWQHMPAILNPVTRVLTAVPCRGAMCALPMEVLSDKLLEAETARQQQLVRFRASMPRLRGKATQLKSLCK